MIIRRIYQVLAFAPLIILVLAFLFRATLYWSIPVADGEPKGGGDVLELLLFMLLLGSCLLCLLFSCVMAVFPKIRNKTDSIKLLVIGLGVPLVFWFLHPLIPRLV